MNSEFPLVELRQYLLRPGRRDELINLFEREFVESQEALGMKLFGLFCDARRPDYFIWLRGFRDMPSRREALEQFYGGPVWNVHGGSANSTMIDSDNVLLLRAAQPDSGLDTAATVVSAPLLCLIFSYCSATECNLLARRFLARHRTQLAAEGGTILAAYVTEPGANTFLRLPVRESEHVLVAFISGIRFQYLASFPSEASQIIELVPTKRSRLQLIRGEVPK
jgi:hypothetical protein